MTISIGPSAIDRAAAFPATYTAIDTHNPADGSGVLTSFEIWHATTGGGVKVGTFHGSSTSYTMRDYEALGTVASGSKQTFTGKNCDVIAEDFIGWFAASGTLENATGTTSGQYYANADYFDGSAHNYTLASDQTFSLAATGSGDANPACYLHTRRDRMNMKGVSTQNSLA